jgi:hypothetical protein
MIHLETELPRGSPFSTAAHCPFEVEIGKRKENYIRRVSFQEYVETLPHPSRFSKGGDGRVSL